MPIDLGLGLLEYGIRILGRIIWYDRIVDLAIDKLHDAIDEIAELRKQFIIVLRDEIPPFELAVGSLYGSNFRVSTFHQNGRIVQFCVNVVRAKSAWKHRLDAQIAVLCDQNDIQPTYLVCASKGSTAKRRQGPLCLLHCCQRHRLPSTWKTCHSRNLDIPWSTSGVA